MKVVSFPANRLLNEAAKTYAERNAIYGDNYFNVGGALNALFPAGLKLDNASDQLRYHIFMLIVVKLSRYANNFAKGGHLDSIHDACVYCAMLESIDKEPKNENDGDRTP